MNIVILTKKMAQIGILHNSLQKEHCMCSIVSNLAMLENESRCKVLHLLLIEKYFLQNKDNISTIQDCLEPLNSRIPIVYFDVDSEENCFVQAKQSATMSIVIEKILGSVQNRIETNKTYNCTMLRPAEKKLYQLLKSHTEESLSLDEMSIYLWGNTSKAHEKTLYTYIHRIKTMLTEGQQDIEWLIKEKKGCYRISTDANKTPVESVATLK